MTLITNLDSETVLPVSHKKYKLIKIKQGVQVNFH